MEKIELSNGSVTIIEGIEQIDAYTKSKKRYHVSSSYKNRSCFMLCEFIVKNKIQPLFFYYESGVKIVYDSDYYINYQSQPIFIDLINEFFLLRPDLQKYVGWEGLFETLMSYNGTLYTKECNKILFKKPIFRCDYPHVCITMDSVDGSLKLQVTKGNGFVRGFPNYGYGGESIELFFSFEDAKKAGLEFLESSKKIYEEKLSSINEKINKLLNLKEKA